MHIVTLTDKDKRYGLVPYLVGRIHGKGEAEPLYADKPGPDGKIQIAKAFATPVGGRVGPRGKFKVPWKGAGLFILKPGGSSGQLKPLEGEYE